MWLQLFYAIAVAIISYAIQSANAPKPKTPTAGNLDVPEPQPGKFLPVTFGTNIIKGSNVIYFGGTKAKAIKSKGGKK